MLYIGENNIIVTYQLLSDGMKEEEIESREGVEERARLNIDFFLLFLILSFYFLLFMQVL